MNTASKKQAAYHYTYQVNLGRRHVCQDGVVHKYQPKKKTYDVQTEAEIANGGLLRIRSPKAEETAPMESVC